MNKNQTWKRFRMIMNESEMRRPAITIENHYFYWQEIWKGGRQPWGNWINSCSMRKMLNGIGKRKKDMEREREWVKVGGREGSVIGSQPTKSGVRCSPLLDLVWPIWQLVCLSLSSTHFPYLTLSFPSHHILISPQLPHFLREMS